MKKNISCFVILLLFSTSTFIKTNNEPKNTKKTYIKLKNESLQLLDGIQGCLDGNAIIDMFNIKKQILSLKAGTLLDPSGNGKVLSNLTYEGKNHTLETLIKEEEIAKKSPNLNTPRKKAELEKNLKDCKTNFIKATVHFMDQIRSAKGLVMNLIHESCDKRNIKQTLLMEWANTNGNEEVVFNSKIKSLKEFDTFLIHVSDFLGDLIVSCEKGFAQYKINQIKKNNAATGRA